MIAAADTIEFTPCGRKILGEHPGPLNKRNENISSEFLLLHRMQNVNLREEENTKESWTIREIYKQASSTDEDLEFLNPSVVNSEDELYFKGNTAVWSRGIQNSDRKASSEICYTSEHPIQFAFFCTKNFLNADYKTGNKNTHQNETDGNVHGVALIDMMSIQVFATNGENLVAAIESPISNIWTTKLCVLIEKDASTSTIDGSMPLPRVFSLAHPLDDMYPVLLKSNLQITYISDAEHRIIFASQDTDMVLMYDTRSGKHFIGKLRKATEDETATVANLYDTTHIESNTLSFSHIHLQSMRGSFSAAKNYSGRQTTPSNSFLNSSHLNSPADVYRSNLASSLADDPSTIHRNSISVIARKIGECEPSRSLTPDLIIEQIWSENNNSWNEFKEIASKGFLHTDFIGQDFICFLLNKSCKLNLLFIDRLSGLNKLVFGTTSSIAAKDAVALPKMSMIAALLPCGSLALYSGPQIVGKVNLGGILSSLPVNTNFVTPSFPKRSSLLPLHNSAGEMKFDEDLHMLSPVYPINSCVNNLKLNNSTSLSDQSGNRVTLTFINGEMYRLSLPPMCESSLVRRIIIALREVMPNESLKLMIRWYNIRNPTGSKDLSLRKEWELFKNLLMDMIGRPRAASYSSSSNMSINTKKARKSDSGSSSDWEYLEALINQKHFEEEDDAEEMTQTYLSDADLFHQIPAIFYTIHLLYEDLKFDSSMSSELRYLSEFLYQLSVDFNLVKFRYHYISDHPEVLSLKSKRTINNIDSDKLLRKELIEEPLNVFQEIYRLVDEKIFMKKFPHIPNVNRLSKDLFELIAVIQEKVKDPSEAIELTKVNEGQKILTSPQHFNHVSNSKLLLDLLIRKKITREQIDKLPSAVSYIICQALENIRSNPPMGCSAAAYKLLLRPELYEHASFKKNTTKKPEKQTRISYENSLTPRIMTPPDVIPKPDLSEDDGMEHIDTKLLRLRFPDDLRINDVKKFLNSSKPVTIDIQQQPNVSDHEFMEEQEKQLLSLSTRTMALPIGRGMFTLRTYFPVLTELLPIPKLCLTGKEISRGATIEIQQIEVPANMNLWPQFHNGVAAGLRIATEPQNIDPTYIMYNKPKDTDTSSTTYAGFLMSLGLLRGLESLSHTYIYDCLIKSEELLSVGLILGLASTYRGTMDKKITRMLSIHIESLLPPTSIELDVSHSVQVAALLGIGLLFQNSNKRFIAEALLQEINRPPGPEMENYVERESYSLAAGLGLGMVTLATGNKDVGLDDLNLPDMLHYYMIGGTKRLLTGTQKEKYKLPSFQIREGDQVNIDVTAPGATLALGLMFFASGNEAVAEWMKPPETMFLLDFVRPDLLLLRVISRGLIMWNSVEPTTEWINSQISKTLSKIIKEKPNPDTDSDLDHEAICQAYSQLVTGAALVIGLRYAGTENPVAFKTLRKIITFFLSANGQYVGEYAGKATVESCIIQVLIALSLVFAGTGDIRILRMIRHNRSRIGAQHTQVTYGSHTAIHMALGFLFLGAGRYTISRRPEAIAALICALFPKFPTHSNDNRYHLQAFRHLYVLAVEPRLFLPRDIDTGKLVVCKLSYIELDQKTPNVVMAPTMLPELDTLKTVYINDPNYWPVTFERGKNWSQLIEILNGNGCIDVVQRAGCLSHLDDPNRLKSLMTQTLTTEKYSTWRVDPKSLLSFTNDRLILSLTKIMLISNVDLKSINDEVAPAKNEVLHSLVLSQVYDCLVRDKIHALGIFIELDNVLDSLNMKNSSCSSIDIWQVKIMNGIARKKIFSEKGSENSQLISSEDLSSLLNRIKMKMEKELIAHKSHLKKFSPDGNLDFLRDLSFHDIRIITQLICFFRLPMNIFSDNSFTKSSNPLQFMYEMKKQRSSGESAFMLHMWKLMEK